MSEAMADEHSELVTAWLAKLEATLVRGDAVAAAQLFDTECYWRDLVALTWNIRTAEGREAIAAMLEAVLPHAAPHDLAIDGEAAVVNGAVEAWFTFETAVARCNGHLRLKEGKGYTILTAMSELNGFEEHQGRSRDMGIAHGADKNRKTWSDARQEEVDALGHARQPYCVIIGGGQGGIALGARLRRLNVPTIIVEKNPRAGDSWRNRYRSLVLHDPVWYDHLPYIPFPPHWPVFTPKDKLGDWLEMYTKVMELNYWGSSECLKASYDPITAEWTLLINRDGKPMTLRPKQLVFATGSYGPPRHVAIAGQDIFKGEQYHASQHSTAAAFRGKRCLVVGGNSSAHDICADMWEHDAEVTMIQRSPTTVVRSKTLMEIAFAGLYSEEAVSNGIDVDKADMIFASVPFRLMPANQAPLYAAIAQRDADLITRLNRAGFRTDYGDDQSGLMMKAFRTGSGYYIDVGASELIASGQIKVRSGVEIARFTATSAILTDGSELPADVVVYATGYLPMTEWVANLVSREAADMIGPNWGYGSGVKGDPGPWQGELRNMWKPLKHEALWFHGGNLHLSRHYSKFVALQIKARMEGIPTRVY